MSEVKDPRIKLFGKTIELPETSAAVAGIGEAALSCDAAGEDSTTQDPPCSSNSILEESNLNGDAEDQISNKDKFRPKQYDVKQEIRVQPSTSEELKDSNATPPLVDDTKALSADDSDSGGVQNSKTEEDQSEPVNSQEKALKKPDKILPCPRCNSMDTKFCYFNNYNVNQPRHFCKNCQRYWTAGGTMRNVPVGAGRRKNKSAASQVQHLTLPETLQGTKMDLTNGIHHPNGTVITFTPDAPLCESMVSVLNIADKTVTNIPRNMFCGPEELAMLISHGSTENGEDQPSGTSIDAPTLKEEVRPELIPNCHPFPPQMPCFPGARWSYPWHSIQCSAPLSPPTFAPASFPLPFYSTTMPYWTFAVPGAWNVPWIIPPTPTVSHSSTHPNSGPNSPTLGKHSRDDTALKPLNPEEETRKESNPEKCLWVPKTLRIDDPGEAAKSSIWATLGIKNDRVESVGNGGGLFNAFHSHSKGDEKTQVEETSTVLQANPAALSRSLSFHESS